MTAHSGIRTSGRTASRSPRQLAAFGIAVLAVAFVPLVLQIWGSHVPTVNSVLGQPTRGMTIAVVTMGGTTAYFPGVTCDSANPTTIRVQLGDWPALEYQPIFFYLAGSSDGSSSIVAGGRSGFSFDQAGEGYIATDAALRAQMQDGNRPTDEVRSGSLTFRGVDRSKVPFTGSVHCSA